MGDKPARRLAILIVEDDPDNAESLELLLTLSGYEASIASDGERC